MTVNGLAQRVMEDSTQTSKFNFRRTPGRMAAWLLTGAILATPSLSKADLMPSAATNGPSDVATQVALDSLLVGTTLLSTETVAANFEALPSGFAGVEFAAAPAINGPISNLETLVTVGGSTSDVGIGFGSGPVSETPGFMNFGNPDDDGRYFSNGTASGQQHAPIPGAALLACLGLGAVMAIRKTNLATA